MNKPPFTLMKVGIACSVLLGGASIGGGAASAYAELLAKPVPISAEVVKPVPIKEEISATSDTDSAKPIQIQINGEEARNAGYVDEASKQIMLPLRELSEALGFEIVWHEEQMAAELTKPQTPIWTIVRTGKDEYAINRMIARLGAAPVIQDEKMYVPASFFRDVLKADVAVDGNRVAVSSAAEEKDEIRKETRTAVITGIHADKDRSYIHIDGAGTEGVILNVDENTVIRDTDGEKIALTDLQLGLDIEAVHSLAMTMSLPGQTYAYEIKVLSSIKEEAELLGTSGKIVDVQKDESGESSIRVKGMKMTETSQDEIILHLGPDTVITDRKGNALKASELKKDDSVLVFYGPKLTRSLPPIGTASKIVVMGE